MIASLSPLGVSSSLGRVVATVYAICDKVCQFPAAGLLRFLRQIKVTVMKLSIWYLNRTSIESDVTPHQTNKQKLIFNSMHLGNIAIISNRMFTVGIVVLQLHDFK